MSEIVLGVDCSTTSARCIAWDVHTGAALAEGRASFPLQSPSPDAYEQDAEAWWSATLSAIKGAVSGVEAGRVAGLCATHQRETFVVTDAEGRPRRPAIVWMDERSGPQVARVQASGRGEAIHEATGKQVCLTPSVYKIMWLRQREPEVFEGDCRVVDVHAFLVRRLTGRWCTSTASADPMGLVDMRSGCWSPEMLGLAALDESHMPALVQPGAHIGGLRAEVARAVGLRQGLPVFAGAGDGQCAGLGAGISRPGLAYLNLGTAVVSGVWSPTYETSAAFRTLYGASPGSFFLETDLKGGTFTLNWLLDKWLKPAPEARQAALEGLEVEAAALPVGAQGLMLVPYWCGVMNPYWDDGAAGAVIGFRGCHGPAHLYRALLEGIAFEQRLHTEGVEEATGTRIEAFVTMGGGARSDVWCQIVADVTGRRVVRAGTPEATALGAGVLAAVGAGLHGDTDAAVAAMTGVGEAFEPGENEVAYDRLFREVYSGLFPAVRGAMAGLKRLTGDRGGAW